MDNQTDLYNPSVLYAKLARITQKMTRIRKTGRHTQGYQFATETDIIESVREAMADENISIVANMVGYQITDGGLTKNGAMIFHTVCEFEFIFVCADTGVTMTAKWFNEALDSSDKGFNKAATAALKYFLMKTFLITTGEPDEHENEDVRANKPSTQQQKPPQAPASVGNQTPATSTPASAGNAAKAQQNAENGQAAKLPDWMNNEVGKCWSVLKAWLVSEGLYENEHALKKSFIKRGISDGKTIADAWKHKPARELIAFVQARHEQPADGGDIDFMGDKAS